MEIEYLEKNHLLISPHLPIPCSYTKTSLQILKTFAGEFLQAIPCE